MSRRLNTTTLALAIAAAVACPSLALAQQQIAAGQRYQGQLASGDRRLTDGSVYDEYVFFGQAGQTIVVDLISSDLDPLVLLWNQTGQELARDDDGGDGLNSLMTYTLPYTGNYRIIANTYGAGERFGSYSVSLRLQGQAMAMNTPQPIGQPQTMGNPGTGPMMGVIGPNQQVQGTLTSGDARFDNKPFHSWGFQCQQGQSFQMDILSDWDNYAVVYDPMGSRAGSDDDGGDANLNARLVHNCQATGVYRLVITTYSTSTTPGMYTLQVQGQQQVVAMAPQPINQPQPINTPQPIANQGQPGVTLPAPVTQGAMAITGRIPDPGATGQITLGQNVQGRLETGDEQMNDGTWADVWQFTGTAGQTVTIELRSEEFDTYLQLLDAAGTRLGEDDDSLGDLDSRIVLRLPSSGVFQIVVNNFSDERRSGVYTLSLR